MNSSYYKNCIVPQCKSTTIETPNKLFIYVPNDKQIRQKWLNLARRNDAHSLSTRSRMYFCEDHFDLPKDMVNYTQYHIMGKVSQVHMKPGCTPSKFECQEDRRKRTCSSTQRPYIIKKERIMTIAESLSENKESCMSKPTPSLKDTSDTSPSFQIVEENVPVILCARTADKSVQACITHRFRSKATQTKLKLKDQSLSPLKPSLISSSTSPLKAVAKIKSSPSVSGLSKIAKNILIKEEHCDISLYTPSVAANSRSTSVQSLQVQSSSNCGDLINEHKKLETKKTILKTVKKIEKNP